MLNIILLLNVLFFTPQYNFIVAFRKIIIMSYYSSVLLTIVFLKGVRSANILGFFPMPAVSHQHFFQPIWRELSLRGHNVTVYTPNPLRNSSLVNLTEIDLSNQYDYTNKDQLKNVITDSTSPFHSFQAAYEKLILPLLDVYENNAQIQRFLRDTTSNYDVVLVEPLPAAFLALGHKFNCPVISVLSLNAYAALHESVGNPVHPVFYPDLPLTNLQDPNLFERLYNVFHTLKIMIYHDFIMLRKCDEFVKKNIGENIPTIKEISRNVSALFVSMNPIFDIVRPLSPLTIPMSFIHIRPPKDLPQDVKKFLDNASEGVIYMSLGSNVRSAFLDKNVIEMFKQTFSELPCKVLWKWENDSLPGISENILLKKWFPQQDILAHRNVRVFIMQGGIQSINEAIFNKVPLIVLPLMIDQTYNAKRVEIVGIGKHLDPYTLTKKILKDTILEVLQNPKYRSKAAEISRLSLDEPMTGIEKAVWWTEYVIRNKGTKYLRNKVVDAPIYKYFMLDILLFLVSIIYAMYLLVKSFKGFKKMLFLCILVLFMGYILI